MKLKPRVKPEQTRRRILDTIERAYGQTIDKAKCIYRDGEIKLLIDLNTCKMILRNGRERAGDPRDAREDARERAAR